MILAVPLASLGPRSADGSHRDSPPADLLQKGSVWKGSRKFPRGGPPVPLELHITSRVGEQFTGRIHTRYGNKWDIEGTVQDGKVEWHVAKVRAGRARGESHTGVLAGNALTVEFQAARAGADGNRKGTGKLVISTYGEEPSRDEASTPAPVETDHSQKMPDVAGFNDFLDQYDRAWEKARRRLEQAVKNRHSAIRKSDLDGDEKLRRLNVIDQDLQAFKKSETLPNSDDLLDVVVQFIEGYQKSIKNLESTRAYWSDKAVRLRDDAAIQKLNALERRLDKIIGGREQFATGSKWSGRRQTGARALQMVLTVTNRTGASFVGRLRQTMGGPGAMMDIDGQLDGNRIAFRSTQMIRGGNRQLAFDGYLLSDRIIARVDGVAVDGNRATGWMSLWRDDAGSR
jgi:hypothetical protein